MKKCFKCKIEDRLVDQPWCYSCIVASGCKIPKGVRDKYEHLMKPDIKWQNGLYFTNYNLHRNRLRFKRNKLKENKKRKPNLELIYKWKKENPEKVKAHRKVATAIKSGKIIKPLICENCYCPGIQLLVAHHKDYENSLDIIWLCKSCHRYLHANSVKLITSRVP